jgi:uncharacterized protein (UPF0332 family)
MEEKARRTAEAMIATVREKLASAQSLHENGYFNDALSRAYYASYHAISLLIFLDGRTYSRHGQLIGAFNKDYVLKGTFSKEIGKALGRLYDARQSGDYDVYQKSDQSESRVGINDATLIASAISSFIHRIHGLDLIE